ncbi:hypothetical protein ACMU_08765 [Actibacterium mucosum KCTC 23349]|uniref:Metallo-beta-lactamase domain-containing protein n=1 Tax=Actibacterium mucosum KCTC 23349 TaxID=1454373 RepID=A0A037ZHD9_9RHOB|nr:MBL fold metallo-hydrolase [Actibacterium mucosum]KAJ55855.1 hypothetical protein ACMU_08765 [Actibacterium mucosum KCTC 23349]
MTLNRRTFFAASAALPLAGLAKPTFAAADKAEAQVNGIYRQKVGKFEITALLDGHLPIGPELINGYDEAKAAAALARQHRKPEPNGTLIPVTGYLINTGDKLIAVDCGTNDAMGPTLGGYHGALAAAGYSADQVDMVIATHLHLDHIGGLAAKDGTARFANAELVSTASEWDFWYNDEIRASVPDNFKGFFDIARFQTTPYAEKLTLAKTGAEIVPGIEIVDLPGHTPGHIGLHLRSEGEELLIWGDIVHATALQFDNPDWTIAFDTDAEQARATRLKVLDMVVTDNVPVAGMHLDFPGFGYVGKMGSAYRFDPMPWRYVL